MIELKLQACKFQRNPTQINWEYGIAFVKEFGVDEVDFIVDSNGNKVKRIWNYILEPWNYETINYMTLRMPGL